MIYLNLIVRYTLICRIDPYLPNKSYMSSEDILYGKFLIARECVWKDRESNYK